MASGLAATDEARILQGIREGTLVVGLDFDGTLVEIVPGVSSTRRKGKLVRLAALLGPRFAILTAQAVAYIDEKTGKSIYNVIGIEGCQYRLAGDGRIEVKRGLSSCQKFLVDIQGLIEEYDQRHRGARSGLRLVEKAAFAFALEYRRMSPGAAGLKEEISELIDRYISAGPRFQRRNTPGYFDVLPAGANKGIGLRLLKDRSGVRMPVSVAAGDGSSDEYAFEEATVGIGIQRPSASSATSRF